MERFHTSPIDIKKIHGNGRFGEFLFFASRVYVMTNGPYLTYKLECCEDEIIKASQLFYHDDVHLLDDLVAEVAKRYDVPIDVAEALIEESKDCNDFDADLSWAMQHYSARAAKLLGYRGVEVRDEQGSAWMIDMLGRESELIHEVELSSEAIDAERALERIENEARRNELEMKAAITECGTRVPVPVAGATSRRRGVYN